MNLVKKYGFVDEARGLAILMVLLVHTTQKVSFLPSFVTAIGNYGQMGVQLFFIASAITMCNSFASRVTERHAIKAFYLRRFFRIAPLYYFAIILYYSLNLITSNGLGIENYTFGNILCNVLFIHGFVPSANNYIVPGGWSIGTEMAFYVIFPILYYFTKPNKRHESRTIIALVLSFIVNLLFQYLVIVVTNKEIKNNNFLYFSLVNQLPVFLCGFLYYFKFWNKGEEIENSVTRMLIQITGFVFFTVLAISMFYVKHSLAYVFLPLLSGLSFIFLLDFLRTKKVPLKIFQHIGKVSYSMYIIHTLFIFYLLPFVLSSIFVELNPIIILICSFVFITLLSFLSAKISEKLIEEKGIALGAMIIKKRYQC